MAEKKEEKREEKHPKVDGKSPAQSGTARSWIMNLMILGIFAGIVAILLTEVVPEGWMEGSSEAMVIPPQSQVATEGKEERVKIPLLGPDQWSSESFDMVRIPKGKEFFLDCPLGGQVLFSDGESGPCMKEGGYSLKRGIVRFKGNAGDHVTVCWGGKCDPEIRSEVPREPQEIPINEYGSGYPEQDKPPGWHLTPRSIQKERERREGVNTSP